uniref:Uncharacterized protein n=1 Tax=Steinernema glaseri TaxID=37863 RepID=A0A1I7ZSV8_9BILA
MRTEEDTKKASNNAALVDDHRRDMFEHSLLEQKKECRQRTRSKRADQDDLAEVPMCISKKGNMMKVDMQELRRTLRRPQFNC